MISWRSLLQRCLHGCALTFVAAVILLAAAPAMAQTIATGDALKAAYLYKLRHYVEWPRKQVVGNEPVVVIGLVGAEEITENLLQMPGASDRPGAKVQVRRLRLNDALDGVQMLFVGADYWPRAHAMVESASKQGILVVSETEGALKTGSVINFRYIDERMRFEISLDAAERAGMKMSSQLLSLAVSVSREKRK